MEKTINYAVIQKKLKSLKDKTEVLLQETGNDDLKRKMNSELEMVNERRELRLAFVGQYSSGKSTIISALTGRKDIVIDANVATDTVTEYRWNNVVLMDTPGILAGKVESHDQRTKDALRECDLIFYVLTSQLFDNVVFNNFIDLAYNQHFADKMFLAVNKMGMEAGDFSELVDNYSISLSNIFRDRGYELTDFPIAFFDAYDYIEGETENDLEFIRMSNFEHFIDMLNSFVSAKGLLKKQFDTPARIIYSFLKNIEVSSIDKTLSDFYTQYENKLSHSQISLKRDVYQQLSDFNSSAMNEVINLSSEIGQLDEGEWKIKQNQMNNRLMSIINETSLKIEDVVNQNFAELMNQVNEFGSKDALIQYDKSLEERINSPTISIEEKKSLVSQRKGLELLKKGGSAVGNMAPNVNSVFGGISGASGSTLHEIVLNVGHFFGKSFKPWEAVRWASNIAKVAKFGIPVVTAGIDIWMQYRENKKEDQRISQIKESKNLFITEYQREINRVKREFEIYLNSVLDNYKQKRDELNYCKTELIETSQRNDKLSENIKSLEAEYISLINEIDEQ